MVTYGDEEKRVYVAKDVAELKIGSDIYALVNFVEFQRGYLIDQTDGFGTSKPVMGTRGLRGNIIIRRTYSTDKDLLTITKPASDGMIPESTITLTEKDDQGSQATATWTIKARFDNLRHIRQMHTFSIAEISGKITEEPSVAYS